MAYCRNLELPTEDRCPVLETDASMVGSPVEDSDQVVAQRLRTRQDRAMSDEPVLQRIITFLDEASYPYDILQHESVSTAQEAAAARSTRLGEGAKAILLKYDQAFGIFVLSAELQIRSARIRRGLRVRRTRFASRQELHDMTGLQPGAVPPFGEPILPLPLFADPSIERHNSVVFTAGSHTTSIRMATADYQRIAQPRVFPFVRE